MPLSHSRLSIFKCTSTDAKPQPGQAYTDALLFETDTHAWYQFDGNSWTRVTDASAVGTSTSTISVNVNGGGNYTSLATAIATEGANKIYRLSPGDHSITSQLLLSGLSNITIEGSGVGVTRILIDIPSLTGAGLVVQGSIDTGKALTVNGIRGDNTLTVASTTGIAAGDWIYLRCTRSVQTTGGGTDAEIHQVRSVSGTVITLRDYIYENYTTATTGTVHKINWCSNFHLKDLTVYDNRAQVTAITENTDALFLFCYNLKISNVKFEHMYFCSCGLQNCYNATLNDVSYESPQFINGASFEINYGIDILSACTNIIINGGWANNCRHSITTGMITGQTYGGGRQRGVVVNSMVSYNANTSHFDSHEGALGLVFNNCHAQGGYHQLASEYASGQTGQPAQTDEVKGFTARSPTVFNACWADNVESIGFAIFNDTNTAGTDAIPAGNWTSIVNCRVTNTQPGSNGIARAVRVLMNREDVQIIGCHFENLVDQPILLESGVKNVMIQDNIFHSCGSNLGPSDGLIYATGPLTDLSITNNVFGAGTPGGARALKTASVNRLTFTGNNLNGLSPVIPLIASGTNTIIKDNIGYVTENAGTFTGSGNNATVLYTIAHGMNISGTPTFISVIPGSLQATSGAMIVSGGPANINVTFSTAPASGTVKINWSAQV